MNQDIRWQQRFQNFTKALLKLEQAVSFIKFHSKEHVDDLNGAQNGWVLDEKMKDEF